MTWTKEKQREYQREYHKRWMLLPGNREKTLAASRKYYKKSAASRTTEAYRARKKAYWRAYWKKLRNDPVRWERWKTKHRDQFHRNSHKFLK